MNKSRSELARMMPDAFPVFFTGRDPYPSQAMVMPEVVRGRNVLFAAPTASGKTEAIVAPLFQRHISFRRERLSTIYVAPTKALVNDIYERLSLYLVSRQPDAIARYTGDRHELRSASGVFCAVVTPEALDSLQLRHPELLTGVRAVVVDEIHLLHGQSRGQQLRHVLARIFKAAEPQVSPRDEFQIVGMTATLNDMEAVANLWLGSDAKVISHGTQRDIDLKLIDVDSRDDSHKNAKALADWIQSTRAEKVLVFANSRNSAHALAAHLHSELRDTQWPVHLHFGALAATDRELVEDEMRRRRYGVCIATNTLEIGIDIGDIDAIVLKDPPRSVTSFLQRIGRGNRRTGTCRVLAFCESDEDQQLVHALVDCARRGEIDDYHEYDRSSVRFQQVLSLCWRATRQDRSLSSAALCIEANDMDHKRVINDMLETGCLIDFREALVPCDRLMDEADAGRIHSVIAGQPSRGVIDSRTGKTAIRDADASTVGGAVFHAGSMRRLLVGAEGGVYLGGDAPSFQPLARIRGTGPPQPISRTVIWALARQQGLDPTQWQLSDSELVTWGGETLNTLLAAILNRGSSAQRYKPSVEGISGTFSEVDVSIPVIRKLATEAELAADLPLDVAGKFLSPSRFFNELSPTLQAHERRNSIPWKLFHYWLDGISGIVFFG